MASVGPAAHGGGMYTDGGEARPVATVLVTGAAGFIGFHVAKRLLERGERVIGVDNLNDYYDVALKEARLALLSANDQFSFHKVDVADDEGMRALFGSA